MRSHDQRRIGWHYLGWIDPERVVLANGLIGNLFWSNIFGDPNAVPLHVARIIRFPERRSQITQIRDELAKLKTVSVR